MNSTGPADGPPMQIGIPLVDYIAGTIGAMAVSMALYHRDTHPDGAGQWIDLSLYETMVRMLDSVISRYSVKGEVRRAQGNRYANVAPSDVYRTRDGRYVFHSSATQTVFRRLAARSAEPTCSTIPATPPTRRASNASTRSTTSSRRGSHATTVTRPCACSKKRTCRSGLSADR